MREFKIGEKVKVVNCDVVPELNGATGIIRRKIEGHSYGDYFVDLGTKYRHHEFSNGWNSHTGIRTIKYSQGLDLPKKYLKSAVDILEIFKEIKR